MRSILQSLKRWAVVSAMLCSVAAAAAAAATDGPGPYAVGFTSFTSIDAARNARSIPIAVFYPADPDAIGPTTSTALYPYIPFPPVVLLASTRLEAHGLDAAWQEPAPSADGPFPLLVQSPGARAPWHAQIFIAARLASHGFVVAVVTHYGAVGFPGEPIVHWAQLNVDRPRDMSFVLDRMLERNAVPGDLLYGLIDPSRVAAGGHSMGGYGAIALAAGHDLVCDPPLFDLGQWSPPETCVSTSPDPRFRALLLLDASNQFLYFDELERVRIPAIGIGEDWAAVGSWQARQHAAFSGHPSYRVDVLNSRHAPSFTNRCEITLVERDLGLVPPAVVAARWFTFQCAELGVIPYAEAHAIVQRYAVAFLKTELAGEPGYAHQLTPGWALTHEPDAMFFVTEKRTSGPPESDWPGDFWYFTTQPGSERAHAAMNPDPIGRSILDDPAE